MELKYFNSMTRRQPRYEQTLGTTMWVTQVDRLLSTVRGREKVTLLP